MPEDEAATLRMFETLLGERVFWAALIMGVLGYDSQLGTIGQSFQTSHNMCWLVAGLYALSAVLQFVGIAFVYNLDKKTLAKMSADLGRNVEANDIILIDTVEENETPYR